MRVIAIKPGYYGRKVHVGEEFEYAQSMMKRVKVDKDGKPALDDKGLMIVDKNGKPQLPSWVVPATDEMRRQIAEGAKSEQQRARDAAIAAAGPKRSKRGFASASPDDELNVA